MKLPPFNLVRPSTIREAVEALAASPDTRCLAGGTDLLVSMKQGLFRPQRLVDITGVESLSTVDVQEDEIVVGAAVPLARLRDFLKHEGYRGAVVEGVEQLAAPTLQRMGTVGGNLCLDTRCRYYNQTESWRKTRGCCLKTGGSICHAAPAGTKCYAAFAGDLAPALMVVGAMVEIYRLEDGAMATRILPVEDLYSNDGLSPLALDPGEVLGYVRIPRVPSLRSGYVKYRYRGSIDFPLVGVAVSVGLQDVKISQVKVAVTGLSPAPLVAREAMELMIGEAPSEELFSRAAQLLTKGAKAVNNQAATPRFRRHMAATIFRRLMELLCSPGAQGAAGSDGEGGDAAWAARQL